MPAFVARGAMMRARFVLAMLGLMAIGSFVTNGCKQKIKPAESSENADSAAASIDPNEPHAHAKTLYQSHCIRCHPMGNRGRGPDLSKTGADPKHTAQWLADHIRSPQDHNPRSNMPQFNDRLSDSDIRALGEYLAGLK